MGQGCEVAARSHRSARRDHRKHAAIQETAEQLNQRRPDSREALRQTVGTQQEQPASLLRAQRFADAASVTADDVELQLPDLVGLDALGRETADAGGNTVNNPLLRNHFLDQGARPLHGVARARTERHAAAAKGHVVEILRLQVASGEGQGVEHGRAIMNDEL